ncbi:MAG: FAD-binding protein [Myxococcota bacterium]
MTILGLHLFHGLRSLSQTFGVNHETYVGAIRWPPAASPSRSSWATPRSPSRSGSAGSRLAGSRPDPRHAGAPHARRPDSRRSPRREVAAAPLRDEAREPVEPTPLPDPRRRLGPGGRLRRSLLGELGYQVDCFCFQDSPCRAHSIAAQGGINAAKNYQNDGDSVFRLFYDTIKGGDFRAREANVHRLAEVSNQIIDQCVAQGVPFARNTAASSTTAPSAAPRSRAPSTPGARPASSSCSAPTAPSRARSRPAACACTPGRRCSTRRRGRSGPRPRHPAPRVRPHRPLGR